MTERTDTHHVHGVLLPEEKEYNLYVVDGRITFEPPLHAETIARQGWILPGLVDAHCHAGLRLGGSPVSGWAEARQSLIRDRDTGVLAVRDMGSPISLSDLQGIDDLPKVMQAGRHVAAVGRYLPDVAIECTSDELPEATRREALRIGGWVKLVADWLDPVADDLTPSWEASAIQAAIGVAHATGARVAAHTFGPDAAEALVNAGVDSIEHGTGLTEHVIEVMARNGTALIPTMLTCENFRAIAAVAAHSYPRYAARLRQLHQEFPEVVRTAHEAGVPIYVGTDAGSDIAHGRIVDELLLLWKKAGLPASEALAAASWRARSWLGLPLLGEGAPADLVVYEHDPRLDLNELRSPALIMIGGRIVAR